MLPKAGIETTPFGSCRMVPEITIWATLVAVGSLTARLPAIVAKGEIRLTPVQSWQLAWFIRAATETACPSGREVL